MQPFGEDRVVEAQRWQLAVLRRPLCVESGQRRLCVSGRRGAEPPHAFLVLWDERALCPEEFGAAAALFIIIRDGRHRRSGWEGSQATPEVSKGGDAREKLLLLAKHPGTGGYLVPFLVAPGCLPRVPFPSPNTFRTPDLNTFPRKQGEGKGTRGIVKRVRAVHGRLIDRMTGSTVKKPPRAGPRHTFV